MTTEPCNWNQYKLVSTETDRDGMTIADGSPALPIPSRPTLLLIYGFCCHTHRRKEQVWVLYAKSDQVEREEKREEQTSIGFFLEAHPNGHLVEDLCYLWIRIFLHPNRDQRV
jgi:hypothetical protein